MEADPVHQLCRPPAPADCAQSDAVFHGGRAVSAFGALLRRVQEAAEPAGLLASEPGCHSAAADQGDAAEAGEVRQAPRRAREEPQGRLAGARRPR